MAPHTSIFKFCIHLAVQVYLISSSAAEKVEWHKQAPNVQFITREKTLLDKLSSCSLKTITNETVYDMWLKDEESAETLFCILDYLHSSFDNCFMWSLAGTSFEKRRKKKSADFCFEESRKLIGKYSTYVKEWHYIAPFVIGKSEFDGDPTWVSGGVMNASRYRLASKPAIKFYSELATNGQVIWSKAWQAKPGQEVFIRPLIDWKDLVSSLGSLGITEWQGWAVGDLVVNDDKLVLAFQCLGVARCIVGDTQIAGDLYYRDYFWSTVPLARGVHHVYVPLRAKVAASFKFSVSSKLSPFKLYQPSFLPDLYDGYFPHTVYVSVPVSNRKAEDWLKISNVNVIKQSAGGAIVSKMLNNSRVAPGQTRPVIVQLSLADEAITEGTKLVDPCANVELKLKFVTSDGVENLPLTLRCRDRGNSFIFTFIDHDGSLQHAAAIEPLGRCQSAMGTCPTVLSLHGTTVTPQNQADSYKRMVNGNFQFGVKGMWLLAPTRHGAHNWEGPGALTAMAALDALRDLSRDRSVFNFEADPLHVLFAGHSMGGHGAWHLATLYPDRAIGLVSMAGWISKEDYGDSNLFFRHDISTSHVDPMLKAVMEASVAPNYVDQYVSNLKGIPILVRVGGNDRTVHPYFVRRMVRVLDKAGVDVTYSELPGLEHWWWDTKDTNDGGCVNDLEMRTFFDMCLNIFKNDMAKASMQGACLKEDKFKGCGGAPEGADDAEDVVTLTVMDPASGEGLKGISVLWKDSPLIKSTIEIHKLGKTAHLRTTNVRYLKINVDSVPNRRWKLNKIKIDGDSKWQMLSGTHIFMKVRSKWISWDVNDDLDLPRHPGTYGPARRVSESPFFIVVGTHGDKHITASLYKHAVYIANQFFSTSDTLAQILEDRDVDRNTLEKTNAIFLGNPNENSHARWILGHLGNLDFTDSNIKLDSCEFTDRDTGVLALAPVSKDNSALLLMGLSPQGLLNVVKLATPTIPPMARSPFSNLLPDYVISGSKVSGPGDFLCAGYWDIIWGYSASHSSCVC